MSVGSSPTTVAAPAVVAGGSSVAVQSTVTTILASGLPLAQVTNLLVSALSQANVSRPAALAAIQTLGSVTPAVTEATVAGPASADVAASEPAYQAAFLINSARRIQTQLAQVVPTGTTTVLPTPDRGPRWESHAQLHTNLADAMAQERQYRMLHLAAAAHRRQAAAQVDQTAAVHGPLLGWYLGQAKTHTEVCKVAAGHDFDATTRPLPGWPGTTHALCACHAGPPHGTGPSVDQVTRPLLAKGLD